MHISDKFGKLLLELIGEIITAFILLSVVLFFDTQSILPAILCLLAGGLLFVIRPNMTDFVSASLASIITPTAAILSVQFNSWVFANDLLFGIPPWLPISWAVSYLLFRRLGETLVGLSSVIKSN
jgi:hypothetical protein